MSSNNQPGRRPHLRIQKVNPSNSSKRSDLSPGSDQPNVHVRQWRLVADPLA